LEVTDILQSYQSPLALLNCTVDHEKTGDEHRLALPLRLDELRGTYYRDPSRKPVLDPLHDTLRATLGVKLTNTYVARNLTPYPRYHPPSFFLAYTGFPLADGISEVYPETWAPVFRPEPTTSWDRPWKEPVLFLYTGSDLPWFVAKITPPGFKQNVGFSCVVTWVPPRTASLFDLIMRRLVMFKQVEANDIPWYEALDDHEELDWRPSLRSHVGDASDTLTVQVEEREDSQTRYTLRFAARRTPEASADMTTEETTSAKTAPLK
jgi:hypothetical protein